MKTFADHKKGFSHQKIGTECEDYAASYADPDGRFFVCVVCDGHSDKNCFRSAKGAEYGCESAIEVLSRFFELLYEEGAQKVAIDGLAEDRLKRSIKQLWDQKVREDIASNPLTEEEMRPLSDSVRNLYRAGKGLLHIYGATFLAVAVSDDYCIALHIGDGVMLFIEEDDTYRNPLAPDEKSEMGSPASLCDGDLFMRENAFRSKISKEIPIAAVVSSDGIGDCMERYQFMESVYRLLAGFQECEEDGDAADEMNPEQKRRLESFVNYYTERGHGVEDDCSLAGIYANGRRIPQVKLPLDVSEQMLKEAVQERENVIADYEKRKKDNLNHLQKLEGIHPFGNRQEKEARREKKESIKEVLRNIQANEEDKDFFYKEKIKMCEEYVKRAGGSAESVELSPITRIDTF